MTARTTTSPTPSTTANQRSRRSVLAAAFGGLAGLAAGRLGHPDPARAAAGSPLVLGQSNDSGTSQTVLQNAGTGAAFTLRTANPSTGAAGIFGWSSQGGSNVTRGVYGKADGPNAYGVAGRQTGPDGLGAGVYAEGNANFGLVASTSGAGKPAIVAFNNTTETDPLLLGSGIRGYSGGATYEDLHPGGTGRHAGAEFAGTIGVLGVGLGSPFAAGAGVQGIARDQFGSGVLGESASGTGVVAQSDTGDGLYAFSQSGRAAWVLGAGGTKNAAALVVTAGNYTNGVAGYLWNSSPFATAHFENEGAGQILWLQNAGTDAGGTGGGDFVVCVNGPMNDTQFRVATDGSAFSDGAFNGGGADFAELLPAAGPTEPGDVLAIGPDGRLVRSTTARSLAVVGVHSSRPGFVGGAPVDGRRPEGHIPLAVVGIVPVHASAENGPIAPGDRLVTATLPGHAMRADAGPEVGSVIGKALEGHESGTGTIRMLVLVQ